MVVLPQLPISADLLQDQDPECKAFRSNIRAYNSVLAFTSVGVSIDRALANGQFGVFTYRIQGELKHQIGSLLPADGAAPKFAQMYIHDTEHELQNRLTVFQNLNQTTLLELQNMMHEYNPYVRVFRQAIGVLRQNPSTELRIQIKTDAPQLDMRRYVTVVCGVV